MPIKSNDISVVFTPSTIGQRACLPFAIVGLLLTAQAQAFLPTPLSVVTTGVLSTSTSVSTPQSVATQSAADISSATDHHDGANNSAYNNNTNNNTNNSIKNTSIKNISTDNNRIDNDSINDAIALQNLNAAQLLASWRKQVQADNLAQHTTWRRLLYFLDDKKSLLGQKKSKSLVDNADFFLSDNGQQDSAAELDAMLVALAQELTTPAMGNGHNTQTNNNAVWCRFPARVQWLRDTLNIDATNIDATRLSADCPELDAWMAKLAPEQLSVMFAQEYLDNPLSAFAHTLLRIDSPISAADSTQIHHAYALNDTVAGNPADNFVIYAIKSMTGIYNNVIEIEPYPEKLAKYLKDDERDTWTYQLALTPAEVQQIMYHVWETKDLALPYYFTTDNCASEILRLIDVVRPQQHLLSQLPYAVIPSDLIQLLADNELLASTDYTPADSTVRQAQLNDAKQVRAQLGYQKPAKNAFNKIKSAALNPASSLSADDRTLVTHATAAADNNPINRHSLQMGNVGIGQRGDNRYVDIGLRAGYHDLLDNPAGFPQFFNLKGLAATLRINEKDDDNHKSNLDSVLLQNFTLIKGRSFNPLNSANKGKTWGASIEATRVNDGSQEEGRDHLVGSIGYETGWSWVFGTPRANTGEMPPQLCYTFATGTAQVGRGIDKGFRVGAGINAGCRYQINNRLRAQAEWQLPYWYHGDSAESDVRGHYWQPITTLGLQYDIDKKQALRVNASYDWQDRVDAKDDVQLSYRRYF